MDVEGSISPRSTLPPSSPMRWPREVVVEHSDGTVSLLQDVALVGGTIRGRRADDVFREGS
jgi:hypothetical protein